MIYLYLKTHNKTGLKYLGKTTSDDPHKYQGSGKLWKRHIKKHGYDVTTEIIFQSTDLDEIKAEGIRLSNLWNIVESKEYANLIVESGDGGAQEWTEESRKKVSQSMRKKGKKPSSVRENMRKAQQCEDVNRKRRESLRDWFSDERNYKSRIASMNKHLRTKETYAKVSRSMSKLKWCNNGIRNFRLPEIPEGYVKGRI